jgi:hypothetical protein
MRSDCGRSGPSFGSVVRIISSLLPYGIDSHLHPSRTAPESGDLPQLKEPVELKILEIIITVVQISDLNQHVDTSLFNSYGG